MGSMQRLKKKTELRYRKGSSNPCDNCSYCGHYVSRGAWITETRIEPRCKIMGLKTSNRYRVRPDYTCDAQETYYSPKFLFPGEKAALDGTCSRPGDEGRLHGMGMGSKIRMDKEVTG